MKKVVLYFILFLTLPSFANDLNSSKYMETLSDFRFKMTNEYFILLQDIDGYLSDNQHKDKSYEIYKNKLRMILSMKAEEGEGFKPALYLRSNIILPQTKEKLQLVFDKYGEDDQINNQIFGDDLTYKRRDDKINVGLKMYLIKAEDRHLYAQLGAKFSSPFGLYVKLNGNRHYYLDDWHIKLENDFYYYIKKNGFLPSVSVDFIKPLNDTFALQERNALIYRDEDDSLELENIVRLHQKIDRKQKIAYSLSYAVLTDSDCTFCSNSYGLSVKYTKQIESWLYFDVIPKINFKKEDDFRESFSFTFNIGMILSR